MVTHDQAKEMHCPIRDKKCIGLDCMAFTYKGYRDPLNVPKGEKVPAVYVCGLCNDPHKK